MMRKTNLTSRDSEKLSKLLEFLNHTGITNTPVFYPTKQGTQLIFDGDEEVRELDVPESWVRYANMEGLLEATSMQMSRAQMSIIRRKDPLKEEDARKDVGYTILLTAKGKSLHFSSYALK